MAQENTKNSENRQPDLPKKISFSYISKKYNLTFDDIVEFSRQKKSISDNSFPVSILRGGGLSSLEAIVKYLRENRKLRYKEIARLLNRNPATLAVSYDVSRKKMPLPFPRETELDSSWIAFSAFENELSILEAICLHLRKDGKSFSEIARLIGKDPRTVWTVCNRAESKLSGKKSGKKSSQEKKVNEGK